MLCWLMGMCTSELVSEESKVVRSLSDSDDTDSLEFSDCSNRYLFNGCEFAFSDRFLAALRFLFLFLDLENMLSSTCTGYDWHYRAERVEVVDSLIRTGGSTGTGSSLTSRWS